MRRIQRLNRWPIRRSVENMTQHKRHTTLRIVIFGLGSIGSRHAKMIKKNYAVDLFAFRSKISGASNRNRMGIPELHTWREVDRIRPDVAFITNPTALHVKTALKCARRGIALFIEKPIGHNQNGLEDLLKIVIRKKLVTYVAYVLRFHPVVQILRGLITKERPQHLRVWSSSYLPLWRPGQNHLKNYSAHKRLGGGVVLDLSHEIDLVQHLLGDITRMSGQFGRQSDVTADSEDYADICIQTKRCPANVHINFMSHIPQRIIQLDFKRKSVVGDLISGKISVFSKGHVVSRRVLKLATDLMYEKQAQFFFHNLDNPAMMNHIVEASRLFKKICIFKENGRYGR